MKKRKDIKKLLLVSAVLLTFGIGQQLKTVAAFILVFVEYGYEFQPSYIYSGVRQRIVRIIPVLVTVLPVVLGKALHIGSSE